MKAAYVVFIVVIVSAVDTVIAACTFPRNVVGEWVYKTYTPRIPDNVGTLSVNETTMSLFDTSGSLFMQIDCENGPNGDGIYTTRLFVNATGSLRYRCIVIEQRDSTFTRLDLGRDSPLLASLDCSSLGNVGTNVGLFQANKVAQQSQYQCVANWTSDSANKGYLLTMERSVSADNIPDYHCFVYDVGNLGDTGELYLSKAGNPPWLCKASQEEASSDDGAVAMRLTKRQDCNNGSLAAWSLGLIISMCISSLFNAVY
ncbi:uncharacterized protein LOC118426414 isoform X2 [Branchiostoma floridae]|uniref:Uncharacterized protein LOC118426414 isoform X2 n=1 Tax=Branchiostoma floridae TaxID=7739 RepID=A0A9J7M1L6_BRAFL|nr:uncharacterized protein LOC118426414 isoform X2 [Branchiostoma floridae]